MKKIRTFFCLEHHEVEAHAKTIGLSNYSFEAVEEGQNGASYEFHVDALTDEDRKEESEWLMALENGEEPKGEEGHSLQFWNWFLLDYLCSMGLLEAGHYLIRINY